MQTNLVIGWPNADGSGKPVIFGPANTEKEKQELGRLISDAKKLHRFPKDVKFLAFGTFSSSELAIYISESTAETLQNENKARKDREKAAAKLQAAEQAVPAARLAIGTAKKNLGRAKENLDRATKRFAAETNDDARFTTLLEAANTKEDKERLQKALAAEQAQTAEAQAALEVAKTEFSDAEKALADAELALPEAIKTLETLKSK
jgi:hypothetical protein